MTKCDFVSIIMPSYNTEKYIGKAIKSVLAQIYPYWELIIVDDCSSDNTDSIVKPFLDDERIRYLKNIKNSGAAVSRNKALREAKGRWIAFLDSDDLWLPDKLRKQINFMNKRGYSFSYTEYEEIDEKGKSLGVKVSGPKRISRIGMYNYCWPGCLTIMYDRNVVGNIQITDIKKNNDYAMWLQACKKTDCYLCKILLAKYRVRSDSISHYSYTELIKWHYKLFKEADNRGTLQSVFLTIRNLFFGVIKKIFYRQNKNRRNNNVF